MKIVRCLRLPDELDAILMDFVRNSEGRLQQTIKTAPKAGQSADELAETLNLNWSAFASKQFPKEVQAKEMPSLFINAPKTTQKPNGKVVYAFRHPTKVDEFQKYQAEMQAQWRAFFNKQGVQIDEEAFYRLSGMSGLKPMLGDLSATSAPEQALLSVVDEITARVANAPSGMAMSALPKFSSDPATDMLLSKYVAEIYGNFTSYLRGRYSDAGIEGIDAIISLLSQARGEYLSRTMTHLTGIQSVRQPIANPSQITVAEVKSFLETQKGLPRSEVEALAQRLSEYFGEADGLSSPDVAFLQVYLLDVINTAPNSMKGIGQADDLNHIRSSVYRAWRIPQSVPNRRKKVSAIIEDLFNKRIPEDTPEPLRRWLQQHGWTDAKPSAPKVESKAEPSAPAKPQPEPAPPPEPTPASAPTAFEEAVPAVEQTPAPTARIETFPSFDDWTPQRANGAMIELEKTVSSVPTNRATAVLKRVFGTPTTANLPSDHFQELLGRLKASERMLSSPFFKEGVESLPPEVRQDIADWLRSLRRFGETVERGVSEADRAEFIRIVDGYLSAFGEAKPAPASAVDEALEQIAEPAPVRAEPEPAPVARTEELTSTPVRAEEPASSEPVPMRAEPEPVRTEEPAPVPTTTPPPSEPAPPPPATPTTPPPSGAIDLPKGIEFEEFGETLRAIMMEYGLPTIRGAKPEYGKMEQLISKYFGSNGSLSSIQDTILTALNEMVSVNAVNAHRGIGKSRFFTIQDGRVVLKKGFQDELTAQINALRQAEPLLHFLSDDQIAGFLVLEDALKALAHSAGDEALEALPFFHNFLAFRLLNPEQVDELPTIISTLAGAMKQGDAQTARKAVEDIEVFIKQRVGEQWFQEVEDKLKDIFTTGIISRLITAFFRKSPVLYYGDGRLTEGEWSSWGTFAKRQFVKTLLTKDEAWATFRANFANPLEVDKLKEGILTTPVVRHPYLMHALLTYADEAGFNLPALVATADVFRRHIDAMRNLYFKSGIPPSTLASIDDFGVSGYRAWLTELRTALQRQGLDDADRVLEQALEAVKGVEDDLLGFEVLKTILGFTNDLDGLPALKQAMNNLSNVMFALHGFYKKAVVANIGEELLPIFRAFQDEGLIGEVIVSEPNFFSGRSLRKALKEEYGDVDADTAFRYFVDGLPPSVRSIYYTAQTAGKGAEFDLFIPSFVADLIAQPNFLRTRQVWDTLNNIFKSSVIVYNPPALIRNAFTNTMLMWYVGGGNIFRKSIRQLSPYGDIPRSLETGLAEAFSLQREAIREIKSGSKLARDLEAIDPSISLLRTYERLPEWEVINSTDSRAVRGFRWISNRAFLKSAHAFQTMSETAAKYASVKELLRRWGKLDNYTVDDLIKAVAETNAWLINYRVVPPAVQFMRKYLGLFPFITFQLNTLINFARHPERFYTDLLRGGVYMERLHNIFYFLANDPLTARYDIRGEQKTLFKLFPEYMRHNPLLVAVPDDRGDVWAMDLTYWLPIGVFETQYDPHPLLGEMPMLLPQLATIGWMTDYKDLVRYFGGAIRPLAEAILNKNLLTGQPIYDENLPELEKARAIGGFLVGQIPFARWLLGMGFGAREVNPIGRTRSTDTLLQRGSALMGIRAYHMDALQDARIKELQAKMNDINRTIISLMNNPTLAPQRKAELTQMYQEKLYDLQQQLDEQQLVWLPMVVRLDGKTPTYINTPADFGAVMGTLQAQRRLKTREDFFNEAYPPYMPPPMPYDLAGAMAEEEE